MRIGNVARAVETNDEVNLKMDNDNEELEEYFKVKRNKKKENLKNDSEDDRSKRQKMIDGWKFAPRGRKLSDGSMQNMSYEVWNETKNVIGFKDEDEYKNYMLSTYTNGNMEWDHKRMFIDLMDEIWLAMEVGVIKNEAGNFLIKLLERYMRIESERGFPINWQLRYFEFLNIYKGFEEDGYINYEINEEEQNNNRVDKYINSESNNFYLWRKNDMREDWKFRKELFKNVKTVSISEKTTDKLVLDSGATNSVCPFEELCFNIRPEETKMDCAG